MIGNYITFDAVSKSYGEGSSKQTVLDNVALSVNQGEQIAVLGHSGSGKSTLLNLISGIDYVDSGKIIINDKILTSLSETERTLFRRRHIGFVYQSFNLIQTLTAFENIQLPLQLNNYPSKDIRHLTADMLERVGLADRGCLLYTSPSPRDRTRSRMPSSA